MTAGSSGPNGGPPLPGIQGLLRFRRDLMHTAFEVILPPGLDPAVAEQAAHEALGTAEKLESEFSRFLPNSDVSRVSRLGSGASTRVCADTFECLRRGLELQRMTGGAFDMAAGVGWAESDVPRSRNRGGGETGKRGEHAESGRIILDTENFEVRVTGRVALDLGAIGKGYAVDRMACVLKEWDVTAAMVHGGRSSVFAWGAPEGCSGWPVTLHRPSGGPDSGPAEEDAARLIARFELNLSASAFPAACLQPEEIESLGPAKRGRGVSERISDVSSLQIEDSPPLAAGSFNGRAMAASGIGKGPHIIDPATGLPVRGRVAAWAFADDATTADGLSTAFMVMEPEAVRSFCERHPSVSAIVIGGDGIVQRFGADPCA